MVPDTFVWQHLVMHAPKEPLVNLSVMYKQLFLG